MHKSAEETRLPVDIDAQPLVQAAAALWPVLCDYQEESERACACRTPWPNSCTPLASTAWCAHARWAACRPTC